jgi:predicted aminopeptidase
LFHELAHQQLYVKNDSEFSESFAMVIEEFGMERWLAANGTPTDLERYRARRERRAQFGELVARQQSRLRALYASGQPPEALRAEKRLAFETLRSEYDVLKASWGGSGDYDAWFEQPLNNAALASVATYTKWVPALRTRLRTVGIEAFYADVAELAKLDIATRARRLKAWDNQGFTSAAGRRLNASG